VGTLKYGHIRQVVAKYRFKLKLRLHKTRYCLAEVFTKTGLTACDCVMLNWGNPSAKQKWFCCNESYAHRQYKCSVLKYKVYVYEA
jgi:hypothetical protein